MHRETNKLDNMIIKHEQEVLDYLHIPSIPLKKWNGTASFKDGVAVVDLLSGSQAYAIATFDSENDANPRIKKTFSQEPFSNVGDIFVVPSYMNTIEDVEKFDMDDDSKKAAETILKEAEELENEGVKEETLQAPENEYCFDFIHNDAEAQAFIKSYNSKHRIKGKLPKTHDALVTRLAVIWAEEQKEKK